MMKKLISYVLLAAMIFMSLPVMTSAAAAHLWEGEWEMTGPWGDLTIEEFDGLYFGDFTLDERILVGEIGPDGYIGDWIILYDDGWGEFHAVMSPDGKSFELKWNNLGDEGWNSAVYRGTRVGAAATPPPVTTPAPAPVAPGGITVLFNGQQLAFDVPPQLMNSRTMVPLRAIFEAMGAEVGWDGDTQTVTGVKGDTVVVLVIGDTSPTINGEVVTIDQPGVIVDGRTLAPLRFVAEAFGGEVSWDGDTQTASITLSDIAPISPQATPTPAPQATPTPTPSGSIDTELVGTWKYSGLTSRYTSTGIKNYTEMASFVFNSDGTFKYYDTLNDADITVTEGNYTTSGGKIYFTNIIVYWLGSTDLYPTGDVIIGYNIGTDDEPKKYLDVSIIQRDEDSSVFDDDRIYRRE